MCHESISTVLSFIFVLKKGKMVCEITPHVVFLNHVKLGLSEPKKKEKEVEHGLYKKMLGCRCKDKDIAHQRCN
jgi:hypothetical protein